MEYVDSKNHAIIESDESDLSAVDISSSAHQQEIEDQPNSLVKQQMAAKQAIKEAQKSKEQKLPWYKKSIMPEHLSMTDKMVMLDNLATMLKAGLALSPALSTLSSEMKNKNLKNILSHLKKKVENGELLSDGMKQYPKAFPDMMTATVEVGEASGLLSETLGHIAALLKAEKELRSKVLSALMYPSIVLLALIGVSVFLAVSVFPQLVQIFEEAGVALPFVLRAVQSSMLLFQNYGWYMMGVIILIIASAWWIFKQPKQKLWLHATMLKLPFAGNLIKEIQLTRFSSNLQVLFASGLPILKSMRIVAKTMGNLKFRKEIIVMAEKLEKGVSMHQVMAEAPSLYPSLMVQLVKVGEETGELESILTKISEFYNSRVNNILTNLSTIIEPVLLVAVGLAVGFIAVSVIGPIYELTNSFSD